MAFDSKGNWKPEDDSVSTRVTKITSQDSPMMQQALTQGLKTANRRGLLNSSMAVSAAQNEAYKAALPIASQEAQQIAQKNLQHMSGLTQKELQQMQGQTQKELQQMQGQTQKDIAAMNIAAHDREKAMSAAAAFANSYAEAFRTIAQQHELPANARNQYLAHLARLQNSNMNLIEQMYNIDLTWATPKL